MSGFSSDWLSLREPYDRHSRSNAGLNFLKSKIKGSQRLQIVDLGCGQGSLFRALAPNLDQHQDWIAIDQDEDLLRNAMHMCTRWAGQNNLPFHRENDTKLVIGLWSIVFQKGDITHLDDLIPDTADIIAGSALLDLVSMQWLGRLREKLDTRLAYFPLIFDGLIKFTPTHPLDTWMCENFLVHQNQDKGFGQALGARSAFEAQKFLQDSKQRADLFESNWNFTENDKAIQMATIEGIAGAVLEMHSTRSKDIDDWMRERFGYIRDAKAALIIGHRDLLVSPM